MKKLLLASAIAVMSFAAHADGSLMVFRTIDGATHSIAAADLDITFADGNMTAANSIQTLTLPLASLATMEFSNLSTVISDLSAAPEGKVSVTSVGGAACGSFPSVRQAASSLAEGIYIVKYEKGETIKIIVRK